MSSKKGYSLEQVDDTNCGVTVATPTEEYRGGDENIPQDENPETTKKTRVSDKEFVGKWMSCDSYVVMSFNVDMTVSAVQARATRLRKAGVQLPSFTRATRKTKEIDVAGLNNMIEAETTETNGE